MTQRHQAHWGMWLERLSEGQAVGPVAPNGYGGGQARGGAKAAGGVKAVVR